jgi:tRNA pseudouridine55 synthase
MRDVELWDVAVEEVRLPQATFRVTWSAGTYMRSLVESLGLKLGPGAHLTALRRLACGTLFTLEHSVTLARLEASLNAGPEGTQGNETQRSARSEIVRNPAAFLPEFKPLVLSVDAESRLRDGRTIPLDAPPGHWSLGQAVKVLQSEGALVAVGEVVSLLAQSGTAAEEEAGTQRLGFRPSRVLI